MKNKYNHRRKHDISNTNGRVNKKEHQNTQPEEIGWHPRVVQLASRACCQHQHIHSIICIPSSTWALEHKCQKFTRPNENMTMVCSPSRYPYRPRCLYYQHCHGLLFVCKRQFDDPTKHNPRNLHDRASSCHPSQMVHSS